jgi:hypothetical protein
MRWFLVLPVLGALAGCVTDQQRAMVDAEFKSIQDSNSTLIAEHKMTHVEAAQRFNAAIERIYGSQVTDADRVVMSYRLALAAEVDAGRMTPEMSNYLVQQRIVEYNAQARLQDEAAQRAALLAVSNSLDQSAAAAAARRPINCASTQTWSGINTTCN